MFSDMTGEKIRGVDPPPDLGRGAPLNYYISQFEEYYKCFEGVIQCVTSSTDIEDPVMKENGKMSVVIVGERLAVSVNPDTGVLIQTNPRKK